MRRAFLLIPLCFLFSLGGWAQDWVEVRSPDLHMISDDDTKSAQTALWRLEQVRTEFGLIMNRKKVNRNRPLLIIGLRNQGEFNSYAGGKPTLPGAFAMSAPDRDYLIADLSSPDPSGLFRAYVLLLLNANYPRTQPWFDEGVAETLAGMDATEKKAQLAPPPEVARTLQGGALVPVAQLIGPGVAQSPEFRATAWLLLRWLRESNQLEASAQYFGRVMLQHMPPEQAFAESFSITPRDLDLALAKFRSTALTPQAIEVPVYMPKETFPNFKLSEADARALKAQFQLEKPEERDKALAELKQLLSNEHDNVEVNRGLGIAYLRTGDLKSAADFIRRAIELKDDNAEMHYLLAVYYNQGSRDGVQVDSAAPTILLQTEKAVAIDSELSDAYSLMAQAQVAMQRADLAEKAMKQAIALRPRDESTLLTFASIQMANSKFADAKVLLNFLKTSSDQDVAQRATQLLANADKERKTESKWASKGYVDPTEDKWKASATADQPAAKATDDEEAEAKDKPDTRKVEYLKGTLMSVQCADKSATLKVNSGKKTWTFNVADRSKALLIGADNFECGWRGVPVSINFRASGAASGDIISLEVD